MKIRKLIELIESDGWEINRQKGDHRQYKHHIKPGLVTISGHLDDEIRPGTLNSVLKQAQIKRGKS
ncbi:MAG: type II toxin-antitoxin system HicA family toxin [Methanoregula sp.]|nr:type II toxin-antitoxin system HicA family toxin [Methanoregula sp.]